MALFSSLHHALQAIGRSIAKVVLLLLFAALYLGTIIATLFAVFYASAAIGVLLGQSASVTFGVFVFLVVMIGMYVAPFVQPHLEQAAGILLEGVNQEGTVGDFLDAKRLESIVERIKSESVDRENLATKMGRARQGDADAQYAVSQVYTDGRGVDADRSEALKWLQKSAEQNFSDAQYDLAQIYRNGGDGLSRDYVKAWMWFDLSITSRQAKTKFRDPTAEQQIEKLKSILTPEQISQAKELARKWKEH